MNDGDRAAQLGEIATARMLLGKMGSSFADLLRSSTALSEVPVFSDDIPRVSKAVSPSVAAE